MTTRIGFLAAILAVSLSGSAWAGNVAGSGVAIQLGITHSSTQLLSTASETLPSYLVSQVFTTGTNMYQMNQIWYAQRTIASGTVDNVDLCGTLTDSFGMPVTFRRLRFMAIQATATNTAPIGVGGPLTNSATIFFGTSNDSVRIPAGGTILWYCATTNGYAIDPLTNDVLQITNTAVVSSTYKIYIGGSNP